MLTISFISGSPGCHAYFSGLVESEEFQDWKITIASPEELREWREKTFQSRSYCENVYLTPKDVAVKGIINKSDLVVIGTDLGDSLDLYAAKEAQSSGKSSCCIVDFWTALSERCRNYPMDNSTILVPSAFAREEIISNGISAEKVEIVGHPQLESLLAENSNSLEACTKKLRAIVNAKETDTIVTYYSQPYSDYRMRYNTSNIGIINSQVMGFDELTVFEDILRAIKLAGKSSETIIQICSHPAEIKGKYNKFISRYSDLRIVIHPTSKDIMLRGSDLNMGINSTVLVESLYLGKPAVSVQTGKIYDGDFLITNLTGATKSIEKLDDLVKLFLNEVPSTVSERNCLDIPIESGKRFKKIVEERCFLNS